MIFTQPWLDTHGRPLQIKLYVVVPMVFRYLEELEANYVPIIETLCSSYDFSLFGGLEVNYVLIIVIPCMGCIRGVMV